MQPVQPSCCLYLLTLLASRLHLLSNEIEVILQGSMGDTHLKNLSNIYKNRRERDSVMIKLKITEIKA